MVEVQIWVWSQMMQSVIWIKFDSAGVSACATAKHESGELYNLVDRYPAHQC